MITVRISNNKLIQLDANWIYSIYELEGWTIIEYINLGKSESIQVTDSIDQIVAKIRIAEKMVSRNLHWKSQH